VWDISDMDNLTGEDRVKRNIHENAITDIKVDDTMTFLITSSDDLKIKFWRLNDMELNPSVEDRSSFISKEDEEIKKQMHK